MTQKSGIPAFGSGLVARGALAAALLLGALASHAGTFDSGSDGSDGALVLTDPGTLLFDPNAFDPPLDPDGDGVYNFTSVEIGPDTVVRMKAVPMGVRPVVWLASGDVKVDGILDLSGENGHHYNWPAVPVAA